MVDCRDVKRDQKFKAEVQAKYSGQGQNVWGHFLKTETEAKLNAKESISQI